MSERTREIEQGGAVALIERVRRDEKVRRIARTLLDGSRRVDVSGLRASAPAFLIEALRGLLDRTIVVCCPDEETARDVYADLKTISPARIELFPEKNIFPQKFELRENLTVRGKRNGCLDIILRGAVDIVVTSLSSFLSKTSSQSRSWP